MKKICKTIKKRILLISLLSTIYLFSNAQIVVNQTSDYAQLIDDFIMYGVTASNITYTGDSTAIGSFSGISNLGMNNGIILATGDITNAEGPNTGSGTGNSLGSGGDPDLALLIPGYSINDATILEFDLVPQGNVLIFKYIFASEEYPEYVGSSFNDVFGFFLSGPGITGPYSNNAINIALIPSTSIPVTIDNVNNGNNCPTTGPCMNCAYYIDQCNSGTDIEYDGFTTLLHIQVNVIQSETYHLKIAIADAGDQAYDSGVLLQCPSLKSYTITKVEETSTNNDIAIFSNPVNFNSYVQYSLNKEENVCIEIYDILGNKINTIVNSKQNSGTYSYSLNNLGSENKGIFILHIQVGDKVYTEKLIVN